MMQKPTLILIVISISIAFVACTVHMESAQPEQGVQPEPVRPDGWVGFKHSGAYVAKFFVKWKEGDQPKYWSSGKKPVGYSNVIPLKGNAHEITITAQADTGFGWKNIFRLNLSEPPNKVYVVRGTTLQPSYETSD